MACNVPTSVNGNNLQSRLLNVKVRREKLHTQPMRRIFYLNPSDSHAVSEFDSIRSVGDGESKIRVPSLSAAAAAAVHLVHPLCDKFDCGVGWTECSVEAFFEGECLQIPHHLHQDVTNVHLLFQQTVVIHFCTSPAYLRVGWLRTVFIVQPLVQSASQPLSFLSTTTEHQTVYQTKYTFRKNVHISEVRKQIERTMAKCIVSKITFR